MALDIRTKIANRTDPGIGRQLLRCALPSSKIEEGLLCRKLGGGATAMEIRVRSAGREAVISTGDPVLMIGEKIKPTGRGRRA